MHDMNKIKVVPVCILISNFRELREDFMYVLYAQKIISMFFEQYLPHIHILQGIYIFIVM
jgi:hypothetical protein